MSDPRAVDPTARDIAEKLAPAYRTMLDAIAQVEPRICLLYTSPSPRDRG